MYKVFCFSAVWSPFNTHFDAHPVSMNFLNVYALKCFKYLVLMKCSSDKNLTVKSTLPAAQAEVVDHCFVSFPIHISVSFLERKGYLVLPFTKL
jgi:hypothetical protein